GKVAAMANRAEAKDFVDVAALQDRFGPERLRQLASEVDPGLTDEDYSAAVRQLAAYADDDLRRYGADPARVRAAFGSWAALTAYHRFVIKSARFADLDTMTLYRLLKLRVDVFVVEQECAYPELDGRDIEPATVHLWAEQDGEIAGYLRILDDGGVARI